MYFAYGYRYMIHYWFEVFFFSHFPLKKPQLPLKNSTVACYFMLFVSNKNYYVGFFRGGCIFLLKQFSYLQSLFLQKGIYARNAFVRPQFGQESMAGTHGHCETLPQEI